jgi:hypothetical protein
MIFNYGEFSNVSRYSMTLFVHRTDRHMKEKQSKNG